jgi:hypothetical protein
MKITKLFGVLALGVALTLVAACESGQLYEYPQAEADDGETIELGTEGDGTTLAAQGGDPFCAPNAFLPAGLDAYAQIRPNGIFDRRIPFVYNFMHDEILSDENLPMYDEYYFGGERSNLFAIFRTVFDDKLRQAAGVGLGDIDCISLGIQSKTGDFCQPGDTACFSDWDTVSRNLGNIPYIGPYLNQAMALFPMQYRSLFQIFQTIQIPDPLVLFNELTSGDVEVMVVMDWEPGALIMFKDFWDWAQQVIGGGGRDSLNLPPDFALMANPAPPTITWGALEDLEGCYTAEFSAPLNNAGVAPIVVVGGLDGLKLWACEAGDYLLLANSEYGINELLGQYELAQQNITAGSFLNDPAYTQTYKALWQPEMGIAPPDVRMAFKLHQLQDNLLGQINARENYKVSSGLGPMIDQFLPMIDRDAEVVVVGLGATLDANIDFKVSLQLYDTASLDNPVFTLGKQVAGNGEIEGYYDTRIRFGVDMSSPMMDSLDMGFYMDADQLGLPMDGYNLAAMMLMTIEELIIDAYLDSLNQ